MTIKQIKITLLEQCKGDKRMSMNLYNQIKRIQQELKKPIKSINELTITRNDYLDNQNSESKVIWFNLDGVFCETCLTYQY